MKMPLALLIPVLALAQAPPPQGPAPLMSPEVSTAREVTFRLRAPNAQKVELSLEGSTRKPMQKDDKGVWSFQTPALEPDIYGYSFVVDGVPMLDPSNGEIKTNALNPSSMVLVPGSPASPWEQLDVPHGMLHRHFHASKIAGDQRDYFVYTPPDYNPSKRYPLFVLLHGMSDKADGWSTVGKANLIFDNLIAGGKMVPTVVVMPLGYGAPIHTLKTGLARDPAVWGKNPQNFARVLLEEVLPDVERHYKVAQDRKHRAIAGLSMGAGESLLVGLNHLDRFAYVAAFSGGGVGGNQTAKPEERFPKLVGDAKTRPELLFMACGESDGAFAGMVKLREWLGAQKVESTWYPTPGAHTWLVWRRYLVELSQKLFKPVAS